MTSQIERYFNTCLEQLTRLREHSTDSIDAAAQAIANAIQDDKGYFLFGSGHSALIAQEAYWRAGGLAPALPIPDPLGGDAERLPGFATVLLAHYDLQPGGVMVVISNSGINPLPIEVALECQARGLAVVAITCIAHSEQVASRHTSGKKLYEIADIVVDTQGIAGDAVLELPAVPGRVGATSTVLGAAIVEAMTVQAVVHLVERGEVPPVLVSANLPQGDTHNRTIAARYRSRLVRYEVPTVDETRG